MDPSIVIYKCGLLKKIGHWFSGVCARSSILGANLWFMSVANNLVFWCRFLNKLEPWYTVNIMQHKQNTLILT